MDGSENQATLRAMMYDLHVDPATLTLIRDQSAKLAALSENLSTWNQSAYARCIRLINSETAESLRHLWKLYSGKNHLKTSFLAAYNKEIKETADEIALQQDVINKQSMSIHGAFWYLGANGCRGVDATICNPLFAYSKVAGSRFAVDKDTRPQAGFHLLTAYARVISQYELNPDRVAPSKDPMTTLPTFNAFCLQFDAWCDSFKRLVNSNVQRLRIRIFAGDAIAFCMGLRQLRQPGYVANCYTRPGSIRTLVLDGENHPPESGDCTPTQFNVIETGYLIDRIGLLNLLPNVIDALKGPGSFLYTSTRVERLEDTTNLMEKLLCGTVSVMCALLGVVPPAYLCGHTFQAFEEFEDVRPTASRPLINRIVWVPTTSTDPKVDLAGAKICCDTDEMGQFLARVYVNMFSYELDSKSSPSQWYKYTRQTFVSLMAFLRGRTDNLDWKKCCTRIFSDVHNEETFHDLVCPYRHELFNLLNRFDLQSDLPGILVMNNNIPHNAPVNVLTVPRSIIQQIYNKLHFRSLPISFQIYAQPKKETKHEHQRHAVVQYCFGTITSTPDQAMGIVEDIAGWQGTSDLLVWAFAPLNMEDESDMKEEWDVGVALTPDNDMRGLFQSDLGDTLSILKVSKEDRKSVKTLRAFPNWRGPKSSPQGKVARVRLSDPMGDGALAESTESFIVNLPVLHIAKETYTTRIIVVGEALGTLKSRESISVDQLSTCTLTVKFGIFQVQCNHSFPVDYQTTTIRVSRVQGWLEVIAPLVTSSRRGRFTLTPFPVILSGPGSQITNCHSPYINFRQLPPLDHNRVRLDAITGISSIPNHLYSMFDEQQRSSPRSDPTMTLIKMHLNSLLYPTNKPLSVGLRLESPSGSFDLQLVFFVFELYLNFNSRSIVAEAYAMPMTTDQRELDTDITLRTKPEVHKWWMGALPSMVESARSWNHTTKCEYITEGIPRTGPSPLCSCGKGKVGQEFERIAKWKQFSADVARIAVQPIFPPW